jgi:hypothetical protein
VENQSQSLTEKLVSKGFVTSEQHTEIKDYQSLGIFSLNNELVFFLYLSVLLFTTGVGTFIYKNIDSIGHLAILAINFIVMLVCFYFSFKKAKGFAREEVLFDHPVYDYLVLAGSILACIFIGYLQFQYTLFGTDFGFVSLFSAVVCFGVAYYFDNKSVLSMAITALITFVGISLTPQTLLENEVYSNPNLSYYGIALGIVLLLLMEYSWKENIKKHFHIIYTTFALHLIGICCIAGLIEDYWFIFIPFMAGAVYYFYKKSYQIASTFVFVSALIYGYIGLNIDADQFVEFLFMFSPFYVIGSIILFIKLVRRFNKEKNAGTR